MTDNIHFSADPGADLAQFLQKRRYSKIAVLLDTQTARYCYPKVRSSLPAHETIEIPSGEEFKNLATCERIWTQMTAMSLDRHAVLIIVGGGVLGDMGGFCAATYKRGIDFVLLPTTLLAQVDASVGGKLGIDFKHFKNHIGVFRTPAYTLLHSGFLETLSPAEKRSGFAEVIKHALIADAPVWEVIRQHDIDGQPWDMLLEHSVKVKLKVVRTDPFEKNLRKTLNAGHTIGHAIESHLLQENRKVLHGEAVAAGLVCETFLATEKGLLQPEEFEPVRKFILSVFGKVDIHQEDDEKIVEAALQDKKNKENRILCVLLEGIGNARWDCEISQDDVKRALSFYRSA